MSLEYSITDISATGKGDLISVSTVFKAVESSDGSVLYTKQLTSKSRVSAAPGWYATMKADLLSQASAAKAAFIDIMDKVYAETGKSSVPDITDDIKTHITENM